MLVNGSSMRRFLRPDIDNIRLVANKLTRDIVVLIPAKYTPSINISWIPAPVNFSLEENGVIKVHPATVWEALAHFTICLFCLFKFLALYTKNQKESGIRYMYFQKNIFQDKSLEMSTVFMLKLCGKYSETKVSILFSEDLASKYSKLLASYVFISGFILSELKS
jgi:hypothetical protein